MLQDKKVFIVAAFFLFSSIIFAQEFGTLRGLVSDSTSSEALSYCNAYIKELGKGANSDSRGYFLIPGIPLNKDYTLIVSYVGYRTKYIPIRLKTTKVTQYNIALTSTDIQYKTIEQTAKRVTETNETNISIQRISPKYLESIPKGVETDVFRSIKYLAGVQSTGDVSAKYYVRGGASNQNLVLVDGITIYNPFHALGLFSVVDPDVVNSIDFYKGGFGAQFGGRLSSVMMINTKDGNRNKFGSKVGLSLLSTKLLVEGPIPNGSFIISGRKSYSNEITKKFLNEKSVPLDFYDFSFKANYANPNFIEGAKFSVNGFVSNDNLFSSDPLVEDYKWSNNTFGFKWFQVGDVPLFFEIGVTASSFKGDRIPKFSGVFELSNKVEDIGINMNFTYMFETRDEINIGFNIRKISTQLNLENAVGDPIKVNSSGTNIILFGRYNFLQIDQVKFDIGARLNLISISQSDKKINFEPRLNLSYKLLEGLVLKSAFGIYQQELTTLTNENEVINIFEPWVVTPNYLPPSKSVHYIAGMDISLFDNLTINLEGYYKDSKNLAILNQNKVFVNDQDFIVSDSESSGLEISSHLDMNVFAFNLAYAYSHSYRKLNDKIFYPKYDVRHSLNLSVDLDIGYGWTASTVWVYSSGLPFTQIIGYYDKYYFNNFFTTWDKNDPRRPYTILGVQNLGRLPDYHRLDFTVSKKFRLEPFGFDLSFSIINAYDRKNIFYFKRDTGERVNMLPFLPSATVRVEL